MAQMAIPAQSAFASGVAELPTVLALLSTLAATRCSQHLSVRSETLDQRAGCGKSARPDPWEPSMSNHRGPPDRKARQGGGERRIELAYASTAHVSVIPFFSRRAAASPREINLVSDRRAG